MPSLKSSSSHCLELFIKCVPRNPRSKVARLESPWVETTRQFLTCLRVEFDTIWETEQAFVDALRSLVATGRLPCLPHFAVGASDVVPSSRFARPVAVWMLPEGAGVWADKADPRCDAKFIALFASVQAGLARACSPIGSNPLGPSLRRYFRNPISRRWVTTLPNEEHFPLLSDYADVVCKEENHAMMAMRSALPQVIGATLESSNTIFNAMLDRANDIIADPAHSPLPTDPNAVAAMLRSLVDPVTMGIKGDVDALDYVRDQAASCASTMKSFPTQNLQRGRIAHETSGIVSLEARQAMGARYSAAARRKKNHDLIAKVYRAALARGERPDNNLLCRETKLTRQSIARYLPMINRNIAAEDVGTNQLTLASSDLSSDRPFIGFMSHYQESDMRSSTLPSPVSNRS